MRPSFFFRQFIFEYSFAMFAIVAIDGKQHLVKVGDQIEVDHRDAEAGATISVDPLLVATEDGSSVEVGAPAVAGKSVSFRVIEHFRNDKVVVFKMKSKKRYHRTRGFRASMTRLETLSIG